MLTNIGFLGYLVNSLGYFLLAIILLISWRGRIVGGMLLLAVLIQTLWSASLAFDAYSGNLSPYNVFVIDIVRYFAWSVFMLRLLAHGEVSGAHVYIKSLFYLVSFLSITFAIFYHDFFAWVLTVFGYNLLILIPLLFSIFSIVLVEQIYRNVQVEKRWAMKFLCIGLGVLFVYDLYIFSDAMLFGQVEQSFWGARGIINALAIPLIAISAKRNPRWSFDIFISRQIVFYSTGVFVVGLYLIFMSIGGYYIKHYGGSWGLVAQTVFLAGAGIVLFVVLSSGLTRAKLKIFLSKHFYKNKYDYREEWLRLIHNISDYKSAKHFKDDIIQTVAGIMQCRGGLLFLEGIDSYRCEAAWNSLWPEKMVLHNSSLIMFLNKFEWVIDFNDYKANKENYLNLEIPDWMLEIPSAWLIVPLKHHYSLIGFLILLESGTTQHANWEDRDLLKAVGRQVSSYLAFIKASEALNQAEQFNTFNRLSAYVVHDLKNLVSQLELIAKNAEAHKDNPEFISDSFLTVCNVVSKMQKMLEQLRKMRLTESESRVVNVKDVLDEVLESRSIQLPIPKLSISNQDINVYVEPDRFKNVMEHLVQNAQEATSDNGEVTIHLDEEDGYAIISVKDTGAGMSQTFIRDHLFRPFYTTKGNAGMGIGVYEAREFVKNTGGYINVESTPGVGSVFTVKLPLVNEV